MGRSDNGIIRRVWKEFHRPSRFLPVLFVLIFLWWLGSLPSPLFDVPYSTVTESSDGQLLGARISSDGQWRFPQGDSVPRRFAACIIQFEDRDFRSHIGVDISAVFRAIRDNWSAGEVVSGASTLSMQVIRMARGNPERTYWEKFLEILRATRLEAGYSKDDILQMYAAHAPFGGNVVGLEAASWRYFGRPPHQLSWSETAALAVLPNAPSMVRPGRNRESYEAKRNRLLHGLLNEGIIDSVTWRLSLSDPLPQAPLPLPNLAPHLTERQVSEFGGGRKVSTLNSTVQRKVQEEVDRQVLENKGNKVFNSSALVLDIESGEVVAYIGNTSLDGIEGSEVDMLNVPRSTGSVLKPFLFSSAIAQGKLTPRSLIADIPIRYGDFTPVNFDKQFRGAVRVSEALQKSLNVPAVSLLRDVGVPLFIRHLQHLGLSDLNQTAEYYGLSLILGGAEVRAVQIAEAYNRWVYALNPDEGYHPLHLWKNENQPPEKAFKPINHPVGVYQTLEIMKHLERPEHWAHWGQSTGREIAWKTGTSYGFRDAWAVGTDGRWLVVVWTGNASNEGRPGVIGLESSAPLMFRIFSALPAAESFFKEPVDEMFPLDICALSGYSAGPYCPVRDSLWRGDYSVAACSFCTPVRLSTDKHFRVLQSCYSGESIDTAWMVLPPAMSWYAVSGGGRYAPVPPWFPGCDGQQEKTIEWIYPTSENEVVKLARKLNGEIGLVVLQAGHRRPGENLFWYVDSEYLGSTRDKHNFPVKFSPGKHRLLITDEQGNKAECTIEVVGD